MLPLCWVREIRVIENFGAGESVTDVLRESKAWTLELHTSKRSGLSSEREDLSLSFWWGSKIEALREQAPIDSSFRRAVHALLNDVCFRMKCFSQNFRGVDFFSFTLD